MGLLSERTELELLRSQLDLERATFLPQYQDLADYILPRRIRRFTSDRNKGDRRNNKIIDSTATLAARTLRSGMMSGITSPARPWFRLTTSDPDLVDVSSVKEYLFNVSERINNYFLKSNLYNVLPIAYGDLGTFGTSPVMIEDDDHDVFRFISFPVGSYMIGVDNAQKVNVFARDFEMTVRNVVEKFGYDKKTNTINWDNISNQVKSLWDNSQYESWVQVFHVIRPNPDFDPRKIGPEFKKFQSIYYERGSANNNYNQYSAIDQSKVLRRSGYDMFPVMCPRWEVTGEDIYGTECPGMTCLGDAKALQTMQKRKAQAIEKMVNPPLQGPIALKHQKVSLLPGDVNYLDARDTSQGLRPVHEVNWRMQEFLLDIQDHQSRINKAYYVDLFLMLAESDRRQITAREIDERHEEKLMALGPVLEQLNQDLLDPLIDLAFEFLNKAELLPKPPPDIEGHELKVEYISTMAQAQKIIGISGIERFTSFASQMAQVNPGVLDKINVDEIIDIYADRTGIPPGIVLDDDKVAAIRQQRAQQQQQMQQMEAMQQASESAKNLSQADLEGNNVLNQLVG